MLLGVLILRPCGAFAQGEGPDIAVDPDAFHFGEVPIGLWRDRAFVVSNSDSVASLVVFATELGGEDAGQFAIVDGGGGYILAPLESRLVTIRFQPTSLGPKTAVLRLDNNDPVDTPFDVPISGIGLGAPDITVSLTTVPFDDVPVGSTETRTVILTNQGAAELVVTSLELTGANASLFSLRDGTIGFSVPPQAWDTLTIRFTPRSAGDKNALLRVFSNDPDESLIELSLVGRGVSAGIGVDLPAGIDFGEVIVGDFVDASLLVSNTGLANLFVDSLSVEGSGASQFLVTDLRAPFTVQPGEREALTLRFFPTAGGAHVATLSLFSNDLERPRLDIPLSGRSSAIRIEETAPLALSEDFVLSVSLPDGFQPEIRELYYRNPGQVDYRRVDITGTGSLLQGIIPGVSVTLPGIEYYTRFVEGSIEITVPAFEPQNKPRFLPARFERIERPEPAPAWTYQLVSVPARLENPSGESVLTDDFGPYNTRRWRLFRWDGGAYAEFPAVGAGFEPGQGFWLITHDGATFDVEDGLSTDPSLPVDLLLEPGWNQIGNPFAFPIAWLQGEIDPRIEAPVSYNGSEFVYGESLLRPWFGYLVYNVASVPVTLTLSSDFFVVEKRPAGGTRGSPYRLRLVAEVEGEPLRDTQTFVGFSEAASEGRDRFDFSEAPPVGPYLRVAVAQEGVRYASNVKPAGEEGQFWDVVIDASVAGRTVSVRLEEEGVLPASYELHVVDMDRRRSVSVEEERFRIDLPGAGQERRLRLVVGTPAFQERQAAELSLEAAEAGLDPAFPNPFVHSTTLPFRVGRAGAVRLEVFTLLGQRVRTLVDAAMTPGVYTVSWDGRNEGGLPAASGVYVGRLESDGAFSTRSMVLLR